MRLKLYANTLLGSAIPGKQKAGVKGSEAEMNEERI